MIYIVHGDNLAKSRAQIANQFKKLGTSNRIDLVLEDVSIPELSTHLNSVSMFEDTSFLVINITDTKGVKEHLTVLEGKRGENIVILYSEKTLAKNSFFIKNADKVGAKIVENKAVHNESTFKFVDMLFYKNRRGAYGEYEKLVRAEADPFYIFTMILYGLRSVAKGFYKAPSFENGSSYTRSKVRSQLKGFGENAILGLYTKMYQLEKRLKIGDVAPDTAVSMAMENVLNSKEV